MGTELMRLIEHIGLGVAWIGSDYRVILNNSRMDQLCDTPSTDLTDHHCYEIFRGQNERCPACPGKEAMETGKSVFTELEKDLKEGERRRVHVHTFPTFAEDGSVNGFVKLVSEFAPQLREGAEQLTELNEALEAKVAERTATLLCSNLALNNQIAEMKKMEAELKNQQQEQQQRHEELNQLFNTVELGKKEWELILDCIKDVVVLVDGEGRIRRSNRALVELTGKGYPELIGQDIQKVFKEGRLPLDVLSRQGGEICHELSGRWYLMNCYRPAGLQDKGGAVITLYDYTRLKELTRRLEESNQMLEVKSCQLEEAYAALKATQLQIVQQEKMASIGQLAAGVAHEINNPIGFMSSNLRTLEKYLGKLKDFITVQEEALQAVGDPAFLEPVSTAWREMKLDFITEDIGDLIVESLDGAERVRKIVQDLKTFSRVDEAESKFVNLIENLESTINIVWNEIKYKATLVRDFAELPPVRCYPHQLSQVFMNLLLNATQAIDKAGQITVKAWQEGAMVFFSVTDTGVGIPEKNLGQIFEPFFTTKKVGKGTGLGLGISYEIVKKHHGDIHVESEMGKGTTFTVCIPIDAMGTL